MSSTTMDIDTIEPNLQSSTGNAKSLIAAIFLQYLCYVIFYIGDELAGIAPSQYKALRAGEGDLKAPVPGEMPNPISAAKAQEKLKKDTEKASADAKAQKDAAQKKANKQADDIKMGGQKQLGNVQKRQQQMQEEQEEEYEGGNDDEQYDGGNKDKKNKKPAQKPQAQEQDKGEKKPSKINLDPLTEQEINDYLSWEKKRMTSISNQIVEYFPRVMYFHTIIVALCAIRSPTDLCVACTYFAMLARVVMVFGFYANKKTIYIAFGSFEIFLNFILLFATMGHKQHIESTVSV